MLWIFLSVATTSLLALDTTSAKDVVVRIIGSDSCVLDTCMNCQCKRKRDGGEESSGSHHCQSECHSWCHYHHDYSKLCVSWRNKVDGGWSAWRNVSSCSVTCGSGHFTQHRTCNNPAPQSGGHYCTGESSRSLNCNLDPCPAVNGGWSAWRNVTSCSVTCGSGYYMQNRTCSNPTPQFGGNDCTGGGSMLLYCNLDPCPRVAGSWSAWTNFSTCSVTCGRGIVLQGRTCLSTSGCTGDHSRFSICDATPCSIIQTVVDGGWSQWKNVSTCSATCGSGIVIQSRVCDSPSPLNGGQGCLGDRSRLTKCTHMQCPVTSTMQPSTSTVPQKTRASTTNVVNISANVMLTFTYPPLPTKLPHTTTTAIPTTTTVATTTTAIPTTTTTVTTSTTTAIPTATTVATTAQVTGSIHNCNKMEVIHGLGVNIKVNHPNGTNCSSLGSSHLPTYQYCNTTQYSTWIKGQNVMDACLNGPPLSTYIAVSSFLGGTYDPLVDKAGVFLGCEANGFKMAKQDCDHPFQIHTINTAPSQTAISNPANYFVILA